MNRWTRLALLTSLYLSQGLPFGFFTQALPVLLRQQGVSLEAISLTGLLAMPWSLKFLWAPLVDRYGSRRFGRRRSWIIPLQLLACAVTGTLAVLGPRHGLRPVLVAVFLTNLFAATQDIATDALAVELLPPEERGLGNGVQVAGYRVGMILGGGALLVLFGSLGWTASFVAMTATLLAATVPIVLFREGSVLGEGPERGPYRTEASRPAVPAGHGKSWLLVSFFRRPGAWRWAGLLFLYKFGEALAGGVVRPMLVDRGFTMTDVGWVLGTVGFACGMLGSLGGGALLEALGRRRAVVLFAFVQSVSILTYAWMGFHGHPSRALVAAAVGLEHLCVGMGTAALFTVMMDVCRAGVSATDYTLQASLVVLATGLATMLSGTLAARLGYGPHFLLAAAASLAGALFALTQYHRAAEDLARTIEAEPPSAALT